MVKMGVFKYGIFFYCKILFKNVSYLVIHLFLFNGIFLFIAKHAST